VTDTVKHNVKKHTVFAFPGITLDHLVASFEARERHVCNGVLLMVSFFCRDNWGKSGEGEVNTRKATGRFVRREKSRKVAKVAHGTKFV
jgi:hypothetical protein